MLINITGWVTNLTVTFLCFLHTIWFCLEWFVIKLCCISIFFISPSVQEVAGENGQSTHLAEGNDDGSNADDARRLVENMEMSITEGTQIYGELEEGDEYGSEVGGDDEDEGDDDETDDDDNESDLQPGEVSVGKKIWTFFTTGSIMSSSTW
ncbi:hypothetical protein MKW98_017732 [Papaver atlanticum]|uniref:Uncharacterized protein n=1 Tax=Papaver atlanticum TaxID=357466 RepID=A0AAD4TBT1_9MAGN|nr:hypothetical protein MKW98_017732 [Papaver atlanticum]